MASEGVMGREVIPFRIITQSRTEYHPTNGIHDHRGMDLIRPNIWHLAAGRSLNSIADAAEIGQSWLQRFMHPDKPSGIKKPNPEKLRPVARVLGVSLADLMNRDLTTQPPPSQSAGLDGRMIGFAIKVADHIKDMALDPVTEEQYEDFLAAALTRVQARGAVPPPAEVPDLARQVIAEIRSQARG